VNQIINDKKSWSLFWTFPLHVLAGLDITTQAPSFSQQAEMTATILWPVGCQIFLRSTCITCGPPTFLTENTSKP
jgi:hypothetical protein